jgi:hypothetical protein
MLQQEGMKLKNYYFMDVRVRRSEFHIRKSRIAMMDEWVIYEDRYLIIAIKSNHIRLLVIKRL